MELLRGSRPDDIEIIGGSSPDLDGIRQLPVLPVFSTEATSFLADLSARLLSSGVARRFPELAALGYWMRPASTKRLSESYSHQPTLDSMLVARGVVFHIAPANVDTIFVYSWFVSLLAGNANVVRLSRRQTPQVDVLIDTIGGLFSDPRHVAIRQRTMLVRFEPSSETTARFSDACDVRVIWGGDTTVRTIREVSLPPLSTEIVFGDRTSVAALNVDAWLTASDAARRSAIRGFVNDAYWFMQMACSSPRLVVWVGDQGKTDRARESFWSRVRDELATRSIDFSIRDYVDKRSAAARLAIRRPVRVEPEPTGDLSRVWIGAPSVEDHELHCGAGLFWESAVANLDDLAPALTSRVQTVAYFGFGRSELMRFVMHSRPRGGDRWVPFGRALDFHHVWDGHDLIRTFSREVTVWAAASATRGARPNADGE
jgi:hypothetical protein